MVALLALLLFAAVDPGGATQVPEPIKKGGPKAAWDWSLEERLEARRLLKDIQVRQPAPVPGDASGPSSNPTIEGSRKPALLLPGELFRQLLSLGFAPSGEAREVFRHSIFAKAADLNLPPDFWQRLEGISAAYLGAFDEARALAAQLRTAKAEGAADLRRRLEAVQGSQCAHRHEALTAARLAFGAKLFDRFLYQAVAPHTNVTLTTPINLSRLEWVERGCK